MSAADEFCLSQIKQNYGGSIKLRSGVKAIRYRLHNKAGMLALVSDLNGYIRNPIRIVQYTRICELYGITVINPLTITRDNGWFVGFWDADGTITLNASSNYQLSISVSNKYPDILYPYKEFFGGYIYPDRGKYPSFKWYITDKDSILSFVDYFNQFPPYSVKRNRVFLITEYYRLKSLKAHSEP